MELHIIGKAPAWGDLESPTSGYVIKTAGQAVLLDCGHGVVAQLRRAEWIWNLETVVLTHIHADHVADLPALSYFYQHVPLALRPAGWNPPALWVPPGGREKLAALAAVYGDPTMWEGFSAVYEYTPGQPIVTVPSMTPHAVEHFVPAYGMRVQEGDDVLVCTADTGLYEGLVQWITGTGLLLAEATVPISMAGHLTAVEAGQLAEQSNAGTLVLTHYSDLYEPGVQRDAAAAQTQSPVIEAQAGQRWISDGYNGWQLAAL
jgi:ribonuclease BN (tRNA processing enzyme)